MICIASLGRNDVVGAPWNRLPTGILIVLFTSIWCFIPTNLLVGLNSVKVLLLNLLIAQPWYVNLDLARPVFHEHLVVTHTVASRPDTTLYLRENAAGREFTTVRGSWEVEKIPMRLRLEKCCGNAKYGNNMETRLRFKWITLLGIWLAFEYAIHPSLFLKIFYTVKLDDSEFFPWGLMEGECQEATGQFWTVFRDVPIFFRCFLLVSLDFLWIFPAGQISLL